MRSLNIIVTAGPTNERIDSVMKITNMSTGRLGQIIAEKLLDSLYTIPINKLYYLSPKLALKPNAANLDDRLQFIQIESAEDLKNELETLLSNNRIDAVIHSAAVGDYKAKYSIRGEDLAKEIANTVMQIPDIDDVTLTDISDMILSILDNPKSVSDDSGKMSSYEPHLMTMMDLTPKVIGCIKENSPDTMLIGFKLLDGETEEKLLDVASALRKKNKADYIIANDLSRIGNGDHWAMLVGENGKIEEYHSKQEIAGGICRIIKELSKNLKQEEN